MGAVRLSGMLPSSVQSTTEIPGLGAKLASDAAGSSDNNRSSFKTPPPLELRRKWLKSMYNEEFKSRAEMLDTLLEQLNARSR